jgi:DNA-binding XRE family transcriptional regulator
MARKKNAPNTPPLDFRTVELEGVRYVILRESVFAHLCQKAGVAGSDGDGDAQSSASELALDRATLAQKLLRRRRAMGLSQAELARRAGIRPETLNRIERGRTTPDFATIRRLVIAMHEAEREQIEPQVKRPSPKESKHGDSL